MEKEWQIPDHIKEHSVIGYQTEDGYRFYFNQFGELTTGDLTF